MDTTEFREEIEQELHGNLLPFWRERSVDPVRGGFIAEMASDGTVNEEADRGLILNARLLWTFAALYRQLGTPRDLELAERARAYLGRHFLDPVHEGYWWQVDSDGRAVSTVKKVYGQAFCVYALSELYLATGDAEALHAARHAFELIERHAHPDCGDGYLEAFAQDWSETEDVRLSEKDMNEPRSMNTHLHLLEAYTNLYRAWPDALVETHLRELITLFDGRILDRGEDGRASHLHHFFDEGWRVRSDTCTYGHDLEAAWLLGEAAGVLGDRELSESVATWADGIATTAMEEALDAGGGLPYEGRSGEVLDPGREWWCQAEAVVGFFHAYQITGDEAFAEVAARVWSFIRRCVVDRSGGEWFWRVEADGTVDRSLPKVSQWKGPYHTVRMCLEMVRRLGEGGP